MSNQVFVTPNFLLSYQLGQPEVSYPIPQDPTAQLLRVTYQSAYQSYSAGTLDATYLFNAGAGTITYYQISPGEVNWKDGPLINWSINYANLPAPRSEGQGFEYYVPGIMDVNTGNFVRWPQRKVVESRLAYTYYHTSTPFVSVTTVAAFQIYLDDPSLSQFVNYIDGQFTVPSYNTYFGSNGATGTIAGNEIVVEPTTFTRKYGNFWEAVTRYVIAQ